MIVTRILISDTPSALHGICKTMGYVRADIWRRYGALGNVGKRAADIRREITDMGFYSGLSVDGTIRAETTKDIVNDLLLYKAAAVIKVRKSIAVRTKDEAERNRLYAELRKDEWLNNSFLHRQMRKHYRHGISHVSNQFVVRSDRHQSEIIDGQLVVTLKIASKYGEDIRLVTRSSGKSVSLDKSNLRIVVKDGFTEIHYAAEKEAGRAHGEALIGIDKGYTEAFTDSDGVAHGVNFGVVLTKYSDQASVTGKQRNKLYALEKKHRKAGRIAKADAILKNNLGRKKLEKRRGRAQKHLRTIAYQSAHSIVDKAETVVSEDLTSPIANKQSWKRFNRRMSGWSKGILAQSLEEVTMQRGAKHVVVNSAYTSQMDSITGLLEGKRCGDKFYRASGGVLQADHNAARNVLARLADHEIGRFTPYKEVKRILLMRSPAQLSVKRLELDAVACQPSAE